MGKKYSAIIYVLLLVASVLVSYIPITSEAAVDRTQVIPKEAIRLRILANSNNEADQILKRHIRDLVKRDIDQWVKDLTSIEAARNVLSSRLSQIEATAKSEVTKQGSNQSVKVEFKKAKFPTKLYGDYLYPAGEYEAIVISLGAAQGENWWCVLFPPLCFLDFSSGTAEKAEKMDKVKIEKKQIGKKTANQKRGKKNKKSVKTEFAIKKLVDKLF